MEKINKNGFIENENGKLYTKTQFLVYLENCGFNKIESLDYIHSLKQE